MPIAIGVLTGVNSHKTAFGEQVMGNAERKYEGEGTPKVNRDVVQLAREHIEAASALLKPQGPELSRIAWMLEDALTYLEQSANNDEHPEENEAMLAADKLLHVAHRDS